MRRFSNFAIICLCCFSLVAATAKPKSLVKLNEFSGARKVTKTYLSKGGGITALCGGPIKGNYVVGTLLPNGKFLTHADRINNLKKYVVKTKKSERKKYNNLIASYQKTVAKVSCKKDSSLIPVSNPTPASKVPTRNPPTPGNGSNPAPTLPTSPPQISSILWSDVNTWAGPFPAGCVQGKVPVADSVVCIPKGKKVVLDLDSTPNLASIDLQGTLEVARKDVALNLGYAEITNGGEFIAGSEAAPFTNKLTITLTGENKEATNMGGRGIMVMDGGKIELIGVAPKKNWLMLNKTAAAGATEITVEDSVDWKAGDEIIVTSTDYDFAQTEQCKIAAVAATNIKLGKCNAKDSAGNLVGETNGLRYLHFGEMQYFDHKLVGVPHEIDERAEVGLLTHNIKVQSPESAATGKDIKDPNKFGGHIMMMGDAVGRFQGVELYRMGQFGELGRYPIHWHGVGDGGAQSFIKSSSVHNLFNRCMTIHKTNNMTLEDNVAYDTFGHCYFIEDGSEVRNIYKHNLGAGVKEGPLDAGFDDPAAGNRDGTGWALPSIFWISNPDNDFIGNSAAGAYDSGVGFWYDIHKHLRPNSISDDSHLPEEQRYHPNKQPFGQFVDNRAHSIKPIYMNGPVGARDRSVGLAVEQGNNGVFKNFTSFKIGQGATWLGDKSYLIEGSRLVGDNLVFGGMGVTLKDSLAVGRSRNPTTILPDAFSGWATDKQGRWALNDYDFIPYGIHSAFLNFQGIFPENKIWVIGSCINCEGDANTNMVYRSFEDAASATSAVFVPDPTDIFGNGTPGSFVVGEQLRDTNVCVNSGPGARGISLSDTQTYRCPFSLNDFGQLKLYGNINYSGKFIVHGKRLDQSKYYKLPLVGPEVFKYQYPQRLLANRLIDLQLSDEVKSSGELNVHWSTSELVNPERFTQVDKNTNFGIVSIPKPLVANFTVTKKLWGAGIPPPILQVSSLSSFYTATESAWYLDSINGKLYVKVNLKDAAVTIAPYGLAN